MLAFLSLLNIDPYWYLLEAVLSSLLGGIPAALMTFICYVTDITNSDNRAWQLAWLNSFYLTGTLAGLFMGPIFFNNYGYTVVFLIAAVSILISWLYCLFIVEETVKNNSSNKVCLPNEQIVY